MNVVAFNGARGWMNTAILLKTALSDWSEGIQTELINWRREPPGLRCLLPLLQAEGRAVLRGHRSVNEYIARWPLDGILLGSPVYSPTLPPA
jgi:hypothetical protein